MRQMAGTGLPFTLYFIIMNAECYSMREMTAAMCSTPSAVPAYMPARAFMKTSVRAIMTAVLFCIAALAVRAQAGGAADRREEPYLVVTYTEGRVELRAGLSNTWRQAVIGDVLKKDDVIRTDRGAYATLTITKGGNILLREESVLLFDSHIYDPVFRIEHNTILLRYGKIRLRRDKYNAAGKFYVVSPHQSNLLTGTDIILETDDRTTSVSVLEGSVLSANVTGLGNPVQVTPGKTSTTGAGMPPSAPVDIPDKTYIDWNIMDVKEALERNAQSTKAVTAAQGTVAAASSEKKNDEIKWQKVDEGDTKAKASTEPTVKKEDPKADQKKDTSTNALAGTNAAATNAARPQTNETKADKPREPEKPWEFAFKMNIGAGVAYFDDKPYNNGWRVWGSLTFTPEITFGPIGLGLYLPFYLPIAQTFYQAPTWHNYDEWDMLGMADTMHDLFIKLYYVQWKKDWFWARFGSIHELSFGNGYLLNQYNNAKNFPTIRKNGFYLNLDFDVVGAEFFDEDITRNNFIAARIYTRPLAFAVKDELLKKFYIGVSFICDFQPFFTNSWTTYSPFFWGNKTNEVSVFALGLDVGLPLVKNEQMSATLYGDFGMEGMGFAKICTTSNVLPAGYYTNGTYDTRAASIAAANLLYSLLSGTNGVIMDMSGLQYGFGAAAGVKGYAWILPWRAEFRLNMGGHYPELFDKQYYEESIRSQRILELYGKKMSDSLGFVIESGMSFSKVGGFLLNYSEYYDLYTFASTGNKLHFELTLDEKVIPNLNGRFTYDRTHIIFSEFISSIFDLNTVMTLSVKYTVFGPLKVKVIYSRYFISDGIGGYSPVDSVDVGTEFTF